MRLLWLCLAVLPGCEAVFPLEFTPGPFDRCVDLETRGFRYTRVVRTTITITQVMAEPECGRRGMVPSAINSADEYEFVRQNFAIPDPDPAPFPDDNTAWIGLTRSGADWVDADLCPTFTSFRPNEGADGSASPCAQLVTDGMIDAPCGNTTNSVICEQPRPAIAGCGAPPNTSRYRPIPGPSRLYADAQTMCDQPGEHLVVIESDTEQAFVDDLAAAQAIAEYWLGADFDPGTFHWTAPTGCPPWFDWDNTEPTLLGMEANAYRVTNVGTRTIDQQFNSSGVICETN